MTLENFKIYTFSKVVLRMMVLKSYPKCSSTWSSIFTSFNLGVLETFSQKNSIWGHLITSNFSKDGNLKMHLVVQNHFRLCKLTSLNLCNLEKRISYGSSPPSCLTISFTNSHFSIVSTLSCTNVLAIEDVTRYIKFPQPCTFTEWRFLKIWPNPDRYVNKGRSSRNILVNRGSVSTWYSLSTSSNTSFTELHLLTWSSSRLCNFGSTLEGITTKMSWHFLIFKSLNLQNDSPENWSCHIFILEPFKINCSKLRNASWQPNKQD